MFILNVCSPLFCVLYELPLLKNTKLAKAPTYVDVVPKGRAGTAGITHGMRK